MIAAAIFRTDLIHGTDALAAMDVWMVIERDPEARCGSPSNATWTATVCPQDPRTRTHRRADALPLARL